MTKTGAVSDLAFKRTRVDAPLDLTGSSLVASSLAQAIVGALDRPYRALPADPQAMYELIANRSASAVDFDGLLKLSWDHGIPVVPLVNLPVGMRKMDGAALMVGTRPVIVLSRRNDSKSWLSFILGHEIAHIALGHLKPNSAIIDVALAKESTYAAESSSDLEEAQADAFSLALLGGDSAEATQSQWSENVDAISLAVQARDAAKRLRIAPGHLVLRYAFRTRRWPEAANALRFLSEDFDAKAATAKALAEHLDGDAVADDLKDLITQTTGVDFG